MQCVCVSRISDQNQHRMLPPGDFPIDDEAMIEAILNDPDHPEHTIFSMLNEVKRIRGESNSINDVSLEVFQDIFNRMNAVFDEMETVVASWTQLGDYSHLIGFMNSYIADSRFKLGLMLRAKRVVAGLETFEDVMEDVRRSADATVGP